MSFGAGSGNSVMTSSTSDTTGATTASAPAAPVMTTAAAAGARVEIAAPSPVVAIISKVGPPVPKIATSIALRDDRVAETPPPQHASLVVAATAAKTAATALGIGRETSRGLSQFSPSENGTVPFGSAEVISRPIPIAAQPGPTTGPGRPAVAPPAIDKASLARSHDAVLQSLGMAQSLRDLARLAILDQPSARKGLPG